MLQSSPLEIPPAVSTVDVISSSAEESAEQTDKQSTLQVTLPKKIERYYKYGMTWTSQKIWVRIPLGIIKLINTFPPRTTPLLTRQFYSSDQGRC